MIVDRSKGLDCMGDAAFVNALESGDIPTLGAMRADIERLATDRQHGRKRLEAIPGALIPLLALLDPAYRYFPAEVRAAAADRPIRGDPVPVRVDVPCLRDQDQRTLLCGPTTRPRPFSAPNHPYRARHNYASVRWSSCIAVVVARSRWLRATRPDSASFGATSQQAGSCRSNRRPPSSTAPPSSTSATERLRAKFGS